MSVTIERLASLIQRELALLINKVVTDEEVGYINITEVKVTKDLSFATIYYTILSSQEETIKKSMEVLEDNKKIIRMELAKKVKNIRKIPDLIFKYDEALAYGNHIQDLLQSINKK